MHRSTDQLTTHDNTTVRAGLKGGVKMVIVWGFQVRMIRSSSALLLSHRRAIENATTTQ